MKNAKLPSNRSFVVMETSKSVYISKDSGNHFYLSVLRGDTAFGIPFPRGGNHLLVILTCRSKCLCRSVKIDIEFFQGVMGITLVCKIVIQLRDVVSNAYISGGVALLIKRRFISRFEKYLTFERTGTHH